ERLGFTVRLVDCGPTNIKITYPADVVMAEAILKSREAAL
ncbi:MAG: 2-C-methyl-D-erythritol 4-phosphate cytidylyltransferase, partial [Clostridia bacterium]|nr:2-C-methyl-D-erythritol 4-phosphate cytidylyltransferase [Clostridia bacterium]